MTSSMNLTSGTLPFRGPRPHECQSTRSNPDTEDEVTGSPRIRMHHMSGFIFNYLSSEYHERLIILKKLLGDAAY
ncbi:uncharacterized protein RAG0_07230 [Rhynchosporium agropyri]|uniref:Uncharacterized protein n=1 Tax=Rhynchosporium agropyri TaxID=914238 RepID=A0A1E1KKI8_9HELO|nr:uncharacterized protein RAG0_07230 [Rhynchosporium agropyri]